MGIKSRTKPPIATNKSAGDWMLANEIDPYNVALKIIKMINISRIIELTRINQWWRVVRMIFSLSPNKLCK
jgi:hypothetical protein